MPAPRTAIAVLLVAATALAAPALAQEAGGRHPAETPPDVRPPVAPVEVDGATLFLVRGVASLPAPERAALVAERIRALARDPAFDPASLSLVEGEVFTEIVAGETRVVAFTDADGAVEGLRRQPLAAVAVERTRAAIREYRAARQPAALLAGGLRALAATAVLALALAAVVWAWRHLDHWLTGRFERRMRSLGVDSVRAGTTQRIGERMHRAVRASRTLVILVAVFLYLHLVLGLFPWTQPLHGRMGDWFVDPLETMARAVVGQLPNIVFLLVLFVVLRWVVGLVRLFFEAVARGSVEIAGFDPEWAQPTFKIVRLAIIAFGVVVAYPYIPGSSSAAFKGVSIFAGVVFSLGSSSVISNFIAGYSLTYRKMFKVGDVVRIGEVTGEVTEVRVQVTHIRTPKNEEVIVPNSTILGCEVTNFSAHARSRGLILHTTVGIGYETPWRQVEAMLVLAAGRTPGLLREPPPFVLPKSLGDFCVVYELNVYCDQAQAMPRLYAALHRSVLDVFNEYGVQIMTPAYEGDPDTPKVVPPEQWYLEPASPEAAPAAAPDAPRRDSA